MHPLRLLVAVGLVAAVARPALADPPPAAAAPDEDAVRAKTFFERGMGHFQLEEYDAAIESWESGFRLKPVPEFLYNIGQAYRLSKRPEKAMAFYKKYLRLAPTAKNRPEVERHIESLRQLIDQQQRTATAPPQDPVLPDRAPVSNGTTTTTPPAPATDNGASLTAAAPRDKPITRRGWFWGVVVGGGALVVGAVVVGVVLGTRSNDPAKTLGGLRF